MTRPRLYADFNGLQYSPRSSSMMALYLHYRGTLADLGQLRLALSEGLEVDVYSDSDEHEDLEVTGLVRFDHSSGMWFVEFENDAVRYVPTRPGTHDRIMECWTCGADLTQQIHDRGLSLGDRCDACGVRVHAPLDPPGAGECDA